jgi:uncharacterized protein GlcG (DUF336 family)
MPSFTDNESMKHMLEESKRIAIAAEQAAMETGINIVVSVVDTHGNCVLLHRMDGAPLHALEMAFKKAYTAASLKTDTESLSALVQPGQPLYGLNASSSGKLVAFGGGAFVQLSGGEIVGIGISGGTIGEDIEVLRRVLDQRPARKDRSRPQDPSGNGTAPTVDKLS